MSRYFTDNVQYGNNITDKNNYDIATITISIGFSVFEEFDDTHEKILNQADKALYKVKENGRNGIAYLYKNKIYSPLISK